MTKKRKSKTRKLGIFFVLCGVVLVCIAAGIAYYNYTEDEKAGTASREIVSELQHELSEQQETVQAQPELPDLSKTIKKVDGFEYVGYITIPDLELELPVMATWDYDKLKYAPCLYSGWASDCDMVIAGHNYRNHFARLPSLERGAKIYFADMNGNVYDYEVGDIELLTPKDVEAMKNSDWDLTLYTCNYGASARVAVRCKQLNKFINQ